MPKGLSDIQVREAGRRRVVTLFPVHARPKSVILATSAIN